MSESDSNSPLSPYIVADDINALELLETGIESGIDGLHASVTSQSTAKKVVLRRSVELQLRGVPGGCNDLVALGKTFLDQLSSEIRSRCR